jgi:hypothetical protein
MDYSTRRQLVIVLGELFWADLEAHHPDIDALHLPSQVAARSERPVAASAHFPGWS